MLFVRFEEKKITFLLLDINFNSNLCEQLFQFNLDVWYKTWFYHNWKGSWQGLETKKIEYLTSNTILAGLKNRYLWPASKYPPCCEKEYRTLERARHIGRRTPQPESFCLAQPSCSSPSLVHLISSSQSPPPAHTMKYSHLSRSLKYSYLYRSLTERKKYFYLKRSLTEWKIFSSRSILEIFLSTSVPH